MIEENYLTVQQTAERLGWRANSVYRAIYAGRLRAVRLGRNRGHIRVPESAIAEILTPRPIDPRVEYAPQPKRKTRRKA
jgi:excisionase family DNA binding protein